MRIRQVVVLTAFALLAVGVLVLARYLHAKGLVWAANASNVAGVVFASVPVLTPLFTPMVRALRGLPPLSRASIPQARDDLAAVLAQDWTAEERWRRVNDPWPMPVRWRAAGCASGDFNGFASWFARLPRPPRLVVLGTAGAGKSTLVTRLARDLIAAREPDLPLPVIILAATWDPDDSIDRWVAGQLAQSRPGLARRIRDETGKEMTLAAALVAVRMVLPIIDGFDEIAEERRVQAIEQINAYGSDHPLVLTSRPDEYHAAAAKLGRGISRATVAEVLPLQLAQADQYLAEATAGDPPGRWDAVFDVARRDPSGPLATVLSTPLMLSLARVVYEKSTAEPSELTDETRFPDAGALEDHLLDAFLPAAYSNADPDASGSFRCTPGQAERWLGFLAGHMEHSGQTYLSWRLYLAARAWLVVTTALRAAFAAGAAWAITRTILARHGTWVPKGYVPRDSPRVFLLGGPLGKKSWPGVHQALTEGHAAAHTLASAFLDAARVRPIALVMPWYHWRTFVITAGILGGLLAFAVVKAEVRSPPMRLSVQPVRMVRQLLSGLFTRGFQAAVVMYVAIWHPWRHGSSLPSISAFFRPTPLGYAALAFCLLGLPRAAERLVIHADATRSVSPAADLRYDRRSVVLAAALRKSLIMLVLWLITGPELVIGYGLLMGAAAMARAITGGNDGAAQSYSAARAFLCLQGRLPWRIMSFLEDARRRGTLRREGALYQFRHIRLQERLAARHPLLSDRFTAELTLITAQLTLGWHVDEDQSLAALHGWQVTIGPRDSYRRYRDPRFNQLSKRSAHGDPGQEAG